MHADVPVAELEPRLLSEEPEHRLRVKRVVSHAESGHVVEDTGEAVEDRIDVGTDQETPELLVIAGVGHDRKVVRRQDGRQPRGKPSAPGAPRKQHHLHRKRSSSEGRTNS